MFGNLTSDSIAPQWIALSIGAPNQIGLNQLGNYFPTFSKGKSKFRVPFSLPSSKKGWKADLNKTCRRNTPATNFDSHQQQH